MMSGFTDLEQLTRVPAWALDVLDLGKWYCCEPQHVGSFKTFDYTQTLYIFFSHYSISATAYDRFFEILGVFGPLQFIKFRCFMYCRLTYLLYFVHGPR